MTRQTQRQVHIGDLRLDVRGVPAETVRAASAHLRQAIRQALAYPRITDTSEANAAPPGGTTSVSAADRTEPFPPKQADRDSLTVHASIPAADLAHVIAGRVAEATRRAAINR